MWPFRRRGKPKNATYSISDPFLIELFGGAPSLAGVVVNERTALGLSAFYRAGALISGTIAGLPLRSLRTTPDDLRERIRSWVDEPSGPALYTPFEWKEILIWHLFMQGNAYLMHRYNATGALVGAYPIHPLVVCPEWVDDNDRDRGMVGPKKYEINLGKDVSDALGVAQTITLDSARMTQIMGPSLDGLKGMSLLALARHSLGTSIAGDQAAARLFSSGALISGLVTPEEDVEPAEAEQIKEDLNARVVGPENSGAIRVINRKLKFTPWQMNADDAQFLGSRQFQIEEIARWTGVPPHLLMQTEKQTSWGTGVSEQNRGLKQFNLLGWTTRIEQRISRLLPRPQFVEFDYAGLEKPDPEREIDLLIKQVEAGLLTLNEARRIRNLPPVDGGDVPRGLPSADPAALLAVGAHLSGGQYVRAMAHFERRLAGALRAPTASHPELLAPAPVRAVADRLPLRQIEAHR